jgi:GNAT superfamily N-acetyltransferase
MPDDLSILEIPSSDTSIMKEIGALRLEVWRGETTVNESLFPTGLWIEPLDSLARHWIARAESKIIAAARLTVHLTLEENPDGPWWIEHGLQVPLPVANFCKLVVHKNYRGRGLGHAFDRIRLEAAREMGARSIIVTASEKNSKLLMELGFEDTGVRGFFPNRPTFEFRGLQFLF